MNLTKEINDAIEKHEFSARRIFVLSPDSSKIQETISLIIESYLKYTKESGELISIISHIPEKYYSFKSNSTVRNMENDPKLTGDPDYYLQLMKQAARMDAFLNVIDQIPFRPQDIEFLNKFVFAGLVVVVGLVTDEKTVPAQFAFPKEVEALVPIPDQILLP